MKKIITALLTASLIVTCAASVGFAAQKTSAKTSTKTVAKKTVAKKTAAKTAAKPAQKTKQLPQTQCKILPGHTETADTLLVTAEWLKNNLNNVILIDCRFASLYQASHIPGAVSAPWTYFVNTTAPNGSEEYGTILPAEQLAKKIGALGINGNRQVVCYSDTGDWGQGAWTVAVLRIAGITNAKYDLKKHLPFFFLVDSLAIIFAILARLTASGSSVFSVCQRRIRYPYRRSAGTDGKTDNGHSRRSHASRI